MYDAVLDIGTNALHKVQFEELVSQFCRNKNKAMQRTFTLPYSNATQDGTYFSLSVALEKPSGQCIADLAFTFQTKDAKLHCIVMDI